MTTQVPELPSPAFPIKEEISRDNVWVRGRTQSEPNGKWIPWIRMTEEEHEKSFWFLGDPHTTLAGQGLEGVSSKRLAEVELIFNDDRVKMVYFICAASTPNTYERIVNWLAGPIAETMKERGSMCPHEVVSPLNIRDLATLTTNPRFSSSKSKDAVKSFLDGVTIESLEADKSYWAQDTSELDEIIELVYNRERDKIQNSDPNKIVNWFVGQVMKETRGTADPSVVHERISKHIN